MFISSRFHGGFNRLARIVGVVAASLALGSSAQAQLLYEHHQGGRHQYNGSGNFFTASFDVWEPIQVNAISGWIQGGTGTAMMSITGPNTFDRYHAEFQQHLTPVPPPGELSCPAMWQGVSNLHWDLVPGTYQVEFVGVSTQLAMPYALGYFGPVAGVPSPYNFARYHFDEYLEGMKFGVRIYGRPLTAIPEPEFYGWGAALFLSCVAGFQLRKRRLSGA